MQSRSIFKLLRFNYAFIILLMSFSSITILIFSQIINNQYNEILDTQLKFNNYIINLNNINNQLDMIIRYESFDRKDSFFESKDELLGVALDLTEIFTNTGLWRRVVDLYYMAETFMNESKSAVRLMTAGYSDAAIPSYNSAKKLFNLTSEYYYNSYEKLLTLVNSEKENANVYRRRLTFIGIGLIGFLILFSSYLAKRFSKLITGPINELISIVSSSSISDSEIDIIKIPKNEIQEVEALSNAYNHFSRRINTQFNKLKNNAELEKKLYKEETKNLKVLNLLKISELKALQSRINPHFMFNSLNMINNVAYLENAEQTTSLLESLGSYLRYNYDKFNKIVTIKDEIENIQDYFSIQKIRMGERLKYEIYCEDKVYSAKLPCLIIQPLVENSLIHGFGRSIKDALVRVSVKFNENRVVINVADNGAGIDNKTIKYLSEISFEDNFNDENSKGIGLHNVINRLHICFNGDINYKIISELDEFTQIEIDIPYIQDDIDGL